MNPRGVSFQMPSGWVNIRLPFTANVSMHSSLEISGISGCCKVLYLDMYARHLNGGAGLAAWRWCPVRSTVSLLLVGSLAS